MDRIELEKAEGEPWNDHDYDETIDDEEEIDEHTEHFLFDPWYFASHNKTFETEMLFSAVRQGVVWYGSLLAAWSIPLNFFILILLLVGLKCVRATAVGCTYPPFRWLMLNFTVVQLAITCFVIPLNVITDKKEAWIFGGDLCRAWLLAQLVFVANTFWTLFAMTFDRFLHTVARLSYIGWSSSRFASLVVVFGSWLISGLVLVPSLITQSRADLVLEEVCATSISPEQSLFVSLAVYGVPGTLILLVLGSLAFANIRLKACALASGGYKVAADDINYLEGHQSNRSSLAVSTSDEVEVASCTGSENKALLVVCISCLLTWGPFYAINVIIPFCHGQVCIDPAVWSISIWIGYSTSGLVPMFWFIDPWMRKQVKLMTGRNSSPKSVAADTTSEYSFQTNGSKKSLTHTL